ncbi:hypothetical protein JB92DRAFT_3056086 [Gautieria morchelliformis]|nr:hypothetical protein JB92DRAFT_3056086 [Gautieria morchelliformis]
MDMASTGTSNSVNSEDAWGQPTTSIIDLSRRPQSTHVPDDWDADDDNEELDPKALWETANTRAPMPDIQLSTTSWSTNVPLPPSAAFETPLRILKRPSVANAKSPSPSSSAQMQKTFKEREAQYQAARERIFGEELTGKDKDDSGSGRKPTTAPDTAKSSVIRNPLGPASVSYGEAKQGFQGRRKKGLRPETGTSISDNGDNKEDGQTADI